MKKIFTYIHLPLFAMIGFLTDKVFLHLLYNEIASSAAASPVPEKSWSPTSASVPHRYAIFKVGWFGLSFSTYKYINFLTSALAKFVRSCKTTWVALLKVPWQLGITIYLMATKLRLYLALVVTHGGYILNGFSHERLWGSRQNFKYS